MFQYFLFEGGIPLVLLSITWEVFLLNLLLLYFQEAVKMLIISQNNIQLWHQFQPS